MIRLIFVIFWTIFLSLGTQVNASSEVFVDSKNLYEIDSYGVTHVTHDITIRNISSEIYTSEFILDLHGSIPTNIYATENSIPQNISIVEEDSKKSLIVSFVKKSLGSGNSKNFTIEYDLNDLVLKSGDVWEINIPKLYEQNVFDTYETVVSIPKVFGEEAYINPQPLIFESHNEANIYHFSKEQLIHTGVTGVFGNFQSYGLSLTYHLENPLNQSTKTSIAIPPDTDYQRVFLESIEPRPLNIEADEDGNWMATYELSPRQRLDVLAKMRVDIYPISRSLSSPSDEYLSRLLLENSLWDYQNLRAISSSLTSPQEIYNYVLQTLNYDYGKIGTLTKRNNASVVVTLPDGAICTDFSDLTIALLRRAGIPAREVQGYAYSTDENLEPISLVEDVLHSWVEYWDKDKQSWIQIDPTWGRTSGEDYLTNFDLKHIAFVRHGVDPLKPYPPGSYNYSTTPQKDVSVRVQELISTPEESLQLNLSKSHNIPILKSALLIEIQNTGSRAIYDKSIQVYHDELLFNQIEIPALLPFSSIQIEIDMPFSLSGQNLPKIVRVEYAQNSIDIPTHKDVMVYVNVISVLVFLLMVLVFIFYKARSFKR